MRESKLSVIFPSYNCRDLIEHHLIEADKWLDLADEIIVVDSFSTDGTFGFLKHKLQHPRITFISRERGLYASWNDAIQRSSGDWIYISTVGDTISRGHLEHLLTTASTLESDVVVSPAQIIAEAGCPYPKGEWPALNIIRALKMTAPAALPRAATQYFAFSAYPLAILGSSASNLFRGTHLRARPFPLEHGHAGDAAWLLRYGHETRLSLTPREGSTFLIHTRGTDDHLPDHDALLLKELSNIQKARHPGKLLRRFIAEELPLLQTYRRLQDNLQQKSNLPEGIEFGRALYLKARLKAHAARLSFLRSRILRQIQHEMTT